MERQSPQSLLSIRRLDVFLKKLYFDVIGGRRTRNADLIVRLYRKHIAIRTGGVEPPDLHRPEHRINKQCVQDYEFWAYDLLHSIQTEGFRTDRAIPISDDLLLLNGAHRLAAAISVGLKDIPIVRQSAGATWGLEWFRRYFSRSEFIFLLNEYTSFRTDCAPVIVWGILEDQSDVIVDALASRGMHAEYAIEVNLGSNFDGFYLLLHQIYGIGFKENNNIRRKAIIHGCYARKITLLHVEPLPSLDHKSSAFFASLTLAKAFVRGFLDRVIDKDLYLTLHAPDRLEEKQRMQRLLYSLASLRFHRNFRYVDEAFRSALSEKLKGIRELVERYALNIDDVCVVGSGVLGAAGIRLPNDIDIVIADVGPPCGRCYSEIDSGVLDILSDYSLCTPTLNVTTDELIEDSSRHFIYDGVRFADLNIVFLKKKISGKAKDRDDLGLVRKYFRRRGLERSLLLRDELLWLESGVRRGFE